MMANNRATLLVVKDGEWLLYYTEVTRHLNDHCSVRAEGKVYTCKNGRYAVAENHVLIIEEKYTYTAIGVFFRKRQAERQRAMKRLRKEQEQDHEAKLKLLKELSLTIKTI